MMRKLSVIVGFLGLAATLLLLSERWRAARSPSAWTQGNILPNADWSAADGEYPAGWRLSGDVKRETAQQGFVLEGPHSLRLATINSVARSPDVKATPGQQFRLGFQALVDPGAQTGQGETQLQVWVHWIDAANDDIRIDKQPPVAVGYGPDGAPTWTPVLVETAPAPSNADRVAISIHSLADERLFIDDLQFNAAGLYVEPWPNGAQAAVSFSVDWETAMGGYLHSITAAPTEAITTGLRARQGTTQLLELYRDAGVRGTWFSNGYNFLDGNTAQRTWMGDPTFTWAVAQNGWRTDWSTRKWFGDDPYGTVASDPAWYFGDLLAALKANNQPIQSHTFSHLYVGFTKLAEWQSDLATWQAIAAEQRVAPATVVAFPFGGTNGMSNAHWQALTDAGVATVVRTRLPRDLRKTDDKYLLIDRLRFQPRLLPGHDILIMPDAYLLPSSQAEVKWRLEQTIAAGGVLDIWAHTNEIVAPEQIAAWRATLKAARTNAAVWVAPIAEIADYWRGIRQVRAEIIKADSPLRVRITNPSALNLSGMTVRLPARATRADGTPSLVVNQDRLSLDLQAGATEEVTIWLEP